MTGYWTYYALGVSGLFVWWAYKKKESVDGIKGIREFNETWDRGW